MSDIKVGDKLYGMCGDLFVNTSSLETKTVLATGKNWVVAQEEYGKIVFYSGMLARLKQYRVDSFPTGGYL